jgi:hypothetical protein
VYGLHDHNQGERKVMKERYAFALAFDLAFGFFFFKQTLSFRTNAQIFGL